MRRTEVFTEDLNKIQSVAVWLASGSKQSLDIHTEQSTSLTKEKLCTVWTAKNRSPCFGVMKEIEAKEAQTLALDVKFVVCQFSLAWSQTAPRSKDAQILQVFLPSLRVTGDLISKPKPKS